MKIIILGLGIAAAGFAVYTFRSPLGATYSRVSTELRPVLQKFSDSNDENLTFFQRLKGLLQDSATSTKSTVVSPPANPTESFLYTVELKNGGKIEGRAVEIKKDIVLVTDDKGVQIEVSRDGVSRIKKIRL